MILQFVRRDRAWVWTPYLAGAAFLASLPRLGTHSWLPPLLGPLCLLLWLRVAPHQRATFFEAALPVSARDLYLARLMALMTVVWVPSLAAIGALLATGKRAGGVFEVACVLTLGLTVNLSVRIRQFAAPAMATIWCMGATGGAAAAMMTVVRPMMVGVGSVAAAAAVFAIAWGALPESFQSASTDSRARSWRIGMHAPALPWWGIVRSLFPWQTAVFVPVCLIWLASGQWIWSPLYLMMAYSQIRISTRWTQALPVPRTALLALSTVPLLLVMLGGAEFGMLTGKTAQSHELVRQGDPANFRATGTPDVYVSRAFWRLAPGGIVPVVRAPWGEAYQPEPSRVLGLAFYNPYAVGANNTSQFEEWQFARATSRIYGRPFTPREFALTQRNSLRPVTLAPRMQILSDSALLVMALFWVWLAEFLTWNRLARLSTVVRNSLTYGTVLGLVLALLLGDLLWSKVPGMLSEQVLLGGLLAVSRHLPENLVLVGLIALAPVVVLFWIADRQVAVAEVLRQGPHSPWWSR